MHNQDIKFKITEGRFLKLAVGFVSIYFNDSGFSTEPFGIKNPPQI